MRMNNQSPAPRGILAVDTNPRGIMAVRAEGPTMPEAVAREINSFAEQFQAFKAKYGDENAQLRADLTELEQKLAEGGLPGAAAGRGRRSPGAAIADKLVKDEGWAALDAQRQTKTSFSVDAGMLLPRVEASITYDSGGLDVSENVGVVSPPQRRRWFRQRLNQATASGGSVEYSRETSNVANNADVIGGSSPFRHEGQDKPESVLEWELVDAKIPTIATWVEASRQILADVGELRNVVDTRLRYFLEVKLEQQLIAGTGTGAQMKGITHADNRVAFTPTSGDTAIDSISRALGTLADTYEIEPDLVIVSNTDLRSMQRTKAVDSGVYLWGGPGGADTRRVWEIDIHATPAMSVGSFAVTSTDQLGTFRNREDARVEVGYRNEQFTQNMVTLLAELRALLTVERPTATMFGSLTL